MAAEIDRQRRYVAGIADAFGDHDAALEKLQIPDDEKLNRALTAVAEREKLSEEAYWAAIHRFVEAVRANPKADFRDRALADFAEKKSLSATAAIIASKLNPSGMLIVSGTPVLVFGRRHLKAGSKLTVNYKNQDYEIELVAIDQTTFSLRYRGHEITRPIKSAK